jgi:aspartokinase
VNLMSEHQPPAESDRIAAVLDLRRLVEGCLRLEQELERNTRQLQEQTQRLERLEQEGKTVQRLAEFGRQGLQQLRQDILAKLRAIVLATGERGRLQEMERQLQQEDWTAEALQCLQVRLRQEFQALYPTRPLSRPGEEAPAARKDRPNLASYRIRVP